MLKILFNFQKLVTRYCRWRHSDVIALYFTYSWGSSP